MKRNSFYPHLFRSAVAAAAILFGTQAHAQWTTLGTDGFEPGGNFYQHIFFDAANTPYASFSNTHGQVMQYNGTTWVFVGAANITAGTANDSWSAVAPNGNIYFSYSNGANALKAEVMMYNGTSWASLGGPVSADTASNTNIVISSTGVPYVSYIDKTSSSVSLVVKKYVAGSWVAVGGAVETAQTNFPSMAIDHNNSIYVAYEDIGATQKVIVKKFNGTSWVALDTPFSALPSGGNIYVSLVIDNANVPYVSYLNDFPAGNSVSVSRYNGTHFTTVGGASFTPVGSAFASLAIDHSNMPYVVYADNAGGAKASVMKYDGTSWSVLGLPDFSASVTVFNTIAIDANNNPYVSFLNGSNGGTTVMKYPVCTPPSSTGVAVFDTLICKGTADTIIVTGALQDATQWYWHTGSCTGALVDSGASIVVTPGDTTTYYVSGHGGCVRVSECVPFTINVDLVPVPTISASGLALTSSAATGYQWYMAGAAIAAATSATYTAATTGWYKVKAMNGNGCSSISDSVFVNIAAGIAGLDKNMAADVYPSPAADVINIDFPAYNGQNAALYIVDNVGRQILAKYTLGQKNTLSLAGLPSGFYFINLVTPAGKQVIKIVKQ